MRVLLLLSLLSLLSNCVDQGINATPAPPVAWPDPPTEYVLEACLERRTLSCGAGEGIWEQELVRNTCTDELVELTSCVYVQECDPKLYLQGFETCMGGGIREKYCVKGILEYGTCQVYGPQEVCDGIDNDDDGLIDDMAPWSCPSVCGSGLGICLFGEEICVENPQIPQPTDVLLIVDMSGSMVEERGNAIAAAKDIVERYEGSEVRWSVVSIAQGVLSEVHMVAPMGDAWAAYDALDALESVGGEGGSEAGLDVIWMAMVEARTADVRTVLFDPPFADFGWLWRKGAKRVIVHWTDEPPQHYLEPKVRMELLDWSNAHLVIFGPSTWSSVVAVAGGDHYALNSTAYLQLGPIINEEVCP